MDLKDLAKKLGFIKDDNKTKQEEPMETIYQKTYHILLCFSLTWVRDPKDTKKLKVTALLGVPNLKLSQDKTPLEKLMEAYMPKVTTYCPIPNFSPYQSVDSELTTNTSNFILIPCAENPDVSISLQNIFSDPFTGVFPFKINQPMIMVRALDGYYPDITRLDTMLRYEFNQINNIMRTIENWQLQQAESNPNTYKYITDIVDSFNKPVNPPSPKVINLQDYLKKK